jgi:hypothetical protein
MSFRTFTLPPDYFPAVWRDTSGQQRQVALRMPTPDHLRVFGYKVIFVIELLSGAEWTP